MTYSIARNGPENKLANDQNWFSFVLNAMLVPLGACLIFLSYYFELMAYQSVFDRHDRIFHFWTLSVTLSAFVSLTLNLSKVGVAFVLVHNKMNNDKTRLASATRVGLLLLSMFATMLVVSGQMVSPNAQKQYDKAIKDTKRQYLMLRHEQLTSNQLQMDRSAALFAEESDRVRQVNMQEIDAARKGFSAEELVRDSKGNFYGPRAQEYEALINKSKDRILADQRQLKNDYNDHSSVLSSQHQASISHINETEIEAIKAIRLNDFLNTAEAENTKILALVSLINDVFFAGNKTLSSKHITIFFAILLTLLIEFAPLLFFTTVFRNVLSIQSSINKLT